MRVSERNRSFDELVPAVAGTKDAGCANEFHLLHAVVAYFADKPKSEIAAIDW